MNTSTGMPDGKALVTGGASGIGAAAAIALARDGAAVVVADIRDAEAEAVAERIRADGGTAHALHIDVTDRDAVRELIRQAHRTLGGLTVLFNNAMADPSDDYSEDERWNVMLESGLGAYWAAATEAAQLMQRDGGGAIVSNASIAGARLGIDFASEAYSAAKAGVVGLTRKLAKRWGPSGIRANCICPGVIETPRWRSPGMEEPGFAARWRRMAPLGRYGLPEEVAQLVVFLASDRSSFITGQDIAIDGGFTTAMRFESLDLDSDA